MPTLPRDGALVVFSIDTAASLEDLETEEAAIFCKEMKNKKYVAYVGRSYPEIYNPFIRYHIHDFYLVSQGLRSDTPPYYEPHMIIPVLPNTMHPTSRLPMNPSLPLPWDNCYISIFDSLEARVDLKTTEEGGTYELEIKDMVRLEEFMDEDLERRTELYQVDHPGEYPPTMLPGQTTESISNDPGYPVEVPVVISPTCPVVTCSYDLSTVDVVNDPKEFFMEVQLMDKLRDEHKAKKAQKIEEAQRLDDEYFSEIEKREGSGPSSTICPNRTTSISKRSQFDRFWRKTICIVEVLKPSHLASKLLTIGGAGRRKFKHGFCYVKRHWNIPMICTPSQCKH